MKSINAKRIAAVTAGAVLLGASLVAAAPVMYGNTEVINAQGKPVVKVVVGASAKASDGVAAANIAAVIGNLAFKSQNVSATLTGTPTCSVGAGGAGGTCAVTDKKATLEITSPGGVVAGAYGFKTYMYGFVDNTATTEDDQLANGGAKVVTGDNLVAFADSTSTISTTSGAFTTKQKAYVRTQQAPVFYEDVAKYKTLPTDLRYVLEFDHSSYSGIPACTLSSAITSTAYNATLSGLCTPEDSYLMSRQRMKIKYLGEDWIISEMSPDTNTSNSWTSAAGTYIKLAKESTPATIVYVGQNITAGAYTVNLADLTIPYGSTAAQAVIKVYDSNNNIVKEDTVSTASSKEITLPNGDKITLRVYKTAPGLTLTKWAEMAVYSQELTLRHNQRVDDDNNKNWTVTLAWGNYSGGVNNWVLKNITLTKTSLDYIAEGDGINIIDSPALYQLRFVGQTLTDAQRDQLKFEFARVSSFYPDEASTSNTLTVPLGDYVCISSAKKAFAFTTAPAASDDRYKYCIGLGNNTPLLYEKPDRGYIRYVPTTSGAAVTVGGGATGGGLGGSNTVCGANGSVMSWDGTRFINVDAGLQTASIGNFTIAPNMTSVSAAAPIAAYTFTLGNVTNGTTLWSVTSANNITAVTTGAYGICYTAANSTPSLYVANYSNFPNVLPFPMDLRMTNLTYNIQDAGANENGNIVTYDATTQNVTGNTTIGVDEHVEKIGGTLGVHLLNQTFVADVGALTFKSTSGSSESKVTAVYMTPAGANSTKDFSQGYVTQRGSRLETRASNSITFKMAKKLGEFQYTLQSSGANVTTGVSTVTLAEGQQTNVQDSTVKVKSISETVGACTVSGGSAGCTADKGTITAELSTGGTSGDFATRYAMQSSDRLTVLDSEAPAAESLILVGGQLVNTVTANTLKGTDVKIDKPGVKVVTEIGNKIVVAGYTADDTQAAAAELISALLAKA